MITTVTQKNMISIPVVVARHFSIRPGYQLDWNPIEGKEEIHIRVIPDRQGLAKKLLGSSVNKKRDLAKELDQERE